MDITEPLPNINDQAGDLATLLNRQLRVHIFDVFLLTSGLPRNIKIVRKRKRNETTYISSQTTN